MAFGRLTEIRSSYEKHNNQPTQEYWKPSKQMPDYCSVYLVSLMLSHQGILKGSRRKHTNPECAAVSERIREHENNEHDRYMILDMILDCETHQAGPTVVVFTNPGKGQFESSLI